MKRKPALLGFILLSQLVPVASSAFAAVEPSLLEMSEQMDKLEKQDFQGAIEKAQTCIRVRNFPCAESQLAKAAKSANSGQDKKTLLASKKDLANEKLQLANEIRRAEEERQAQIRREEREARLEQEREEQREREEQQARAAEERQSTSDYYAAIGAQILQRGAENAALLNSIDRQTIAALNESSRVRAAQAAERDRARAEREDRDAERRRELEHRREAAREREAAQRAERATVAATTPEPRKYTPQVVVIPKGPETCPPGSSPARQANGQYVTIPPAAYCIKDPQSASSSNSTSASNSEQPLSTSATISKRSPTSGSSGGNSESDAPRQPTTIKQPPKSEWGPIQLEAFAICRKSEKNGKWWCDGPGQALSLFDSPTVEAALESVGCSPATSAAGASTKDGKYADLYRCGFGLRSHDRNIAKIHGVVTAPRSYMCPKYQGAKCTDFYTGQDKR